jgi:hypothetical protein
VAEGARLESVYTFTGIGGSNPSLSASYFVLLHLTRCDTVGFSPGYSPYADQSWISAILAIHLPLSPKLRICPTGQFPTDLVRIVLAGEINLGLLTQPPLDSQILSLLTRVIRGPLIKFPL